MKDSLYHKLGGKEAIAQVVEDFYKRVLADETVNSYFLHTDMDKQRRHQTAFISYALGGAVYSGRSMAEAHKGMNLQPQHFDAIVTHLKASLKHLGVGQEDIEQVVSTVATLQDDILYK
ncbi:group 1 truncated hemoglobin [Paenibacillus sp. FJAT-26967]|uniref:group I truncated hemoglobin n=1 Tax=Paenibacillus sp. FJAT-26967 TaxID=1729690 RepID=UPI000838889E|nr:group 1 truncated hemoglobin [Paenibacillus sp. FJAT-26967]